MSETCESNRPESVSLMTDCNLNDEDLTESAKNQFSYHKGVLDIFRLYRHNILNHRLMTPVGRHILLSRIEQQYRNFKNTLNYMAANSEIFQKKLPEKGPIVICGLPRTGSTLLYNLLACDPNCRAPLYTDMYMDPIPPLPRHDIVNHAKRAQKIKDDANSIGKLIKRRNTSVGSHPNHPVEEDQMILQHVALDIRLIVGCAIGHEFEHWYYDPTNKNFAFEYHKNYLQMLNSVDTPPSHWVLKTPNHAVHFEHLLRCYPNAQIIMSHRPPTEVVPSYCRLMWEYARLYLDENNPESPISLTTRAVSHVLKTKVGVVKFRTQYQHLCEDIFDVKYYDLIKDPIAVVRRIYDRFGYKWSDEFENAISTWLQNNPQGKQGRNLYSLSDFGLVKEEVEASYADYIELFLKEEATKPNHPDS